MTRKIALPRITEDNVVQEIITRLTLNRCRVFRIKERIPDFKNGRKVWRGRDFTGSGASTPGIPDLIGYLPKQYDAIGIPRAFYIEVKAPGGKQRPAQIDFIGDAKEAGFIAFFADCWADCLIHFADGGVNLK